MSKTASNLFSPSAYALWTAPLGTTLPTTLTASPGAAWYEIGYLSDAGITEGRNLNENKVYDMVGQLLRIIRNQEERPFTFTALEDNRVVRELRYPGSVLSTAAGTSEVQSVTVSATGGTFTLSGGYGGSSVTSAITVSGLTNSALQTAIRTLPGFSAAVVAGSGPYTVTFPAAIGDVAQMVVDATLATGGSVTVTTSTPGVASTNTRAVGSGIALNARCWYAYAAGSAGKAQAFAFGNAEAVQTGTLGLTSTGVKASDFTLNPFPDASNYFFYLLDNDAAQAVAFA